MGVVPRYYMFALTLYADVMGEAPTQKAKEITGLIECFTDASGFCCTRVAPKGDR